MADLAQAVTINITGNSASLVAAANQASGALTQVESAAQKSGGVLNSVFAGIGQGFGIAAGIAGLNGVAGALGAVQSAAVGLNSKLEQAKIGFTSMLGSAETASAFLRDLQQFAAKTPFAFPELVQASQRMLAYGFAASEVKPLLTAVGSAASAMGTGAGGVDRITRALGQMRTATVVQLGELNQLSEQGVPALQILADAMGVTTQQARKMVEQGKVSSEVFIEAFKVWAGANFGDMMAKQARTFEGAMSTIQDVVSMTTANAFKPLFEAISAGAVTLSEFLQGDNFQTWAVALEVGFRSAIEWVGSFLSALAPIGEAVSTAFGQFTSGEFAAGFATIGTALQTVFGSALASVQAFAAEMFGAGATLVGELASGIIDAGSSLLTSAVNSIAEIIASFLVGNSPPEQGPLAAIGQGGANTIAAWGEGALGAVDSAVSPVVAAVAGNLDQLKDAGRGADQAIRDIGSAIRDLESQSRDLKNAAEDVKRVYDDQIKALDEQIKAIDKAAEGTRDREKLEMSLEEHMLKQAEVTALGDPVLRAQLRTRLDALKAQQETRRNAEAMADAEQAITGTRKDQLKDQQEALKFSQQEADLRERLAKAKTPEDRARIQAQLKELEVRRQIGQEEDADRRKAAERRIADAKAKQAELAIEQELDAMTDKEALARVKSEQATLAARKAELEMADRRAKIEAALATGPLKEERERLVKERDAMLTPMQAQLELISRQKEALTEQRQEQQAVKQEITATMAALKEQAKAQDAATQAVKKTAEAYTPDNLAEAAVKKAREAGTKLAGEIGVGFSGWVKANFPTIAGGALGAVLGGMAFGPLGAVAGSGIATALVQGIQARLAEQGLDLSMLFTKIGDEIGKLGEALRPTFQRLTEVVRTAFSGDIQGALDKFLISMSLTQTELGPIIERWGTAFAGLAEKIGTWLGAQVEKIPWAAVWAQTKLTAGMIVDGILSGVRAIDAALTDWLSKAIEAINWPELGRSVGRFLVGPVQQGIDGIGPQLKPEQLRQAIADFLTGVVTGAWEQTLEHWRALAPGESYAAVFVEGLDRGGMADALAAVYRRLNEEFLAHREQDRQNIIAWNAERTAAIEAGYADWRTRQQAVFDDLVAQFIAHRETDIANFQQWNTDTTAIVVAWADSWKLTIQTWSTDTTLTLTTWAAGWKTTLDQWNTDSTETVTAWATDTWKILSDNWDAIWARAGEGLDAVHAVVVEKFTAITGFFTQTIPQWIDAGKQMADGLVKAVGDGLMALAETVIGPIRSAIDSVKGMLNFGGGMTSMSWRGAGAANPNASQAEVEQFAYQAAKGRGWSDKDAQELVSLISGEGAGQGARAVGDSGRSFGPMQLFTGGGLGNRALDAGLNVRDPSTWQQQVLFGMEAIEREGAGQWTVGRNRNLLQAPPVRVAVPNASAASTSALGNITMTQAQWGTSMAGMTAEEAAAACGPYAAFLFAQATGRNPNPQEAEELARLSGWTPAGMGGTANFMDLLGRYGVNAVRDSTPTEQEAINGGSLVGFSTPKHYFASTGFDPATGKFNVGATGTYVGGSAMMSYDEIARIGGGIQDIITLAGQMGPAFQKAGEESSTGIAVAATGTDAAGQKIVGITSMLRDDMGNLTQIYQENGLVLGMSVTNAAGEIIRAWGTMAQEVPAQATAMTESVLGSVTAMGDGTVTTVTNANGIITSIVTDAAGIVTSQTAQMANGVLLDTANMATGALGSVTQLHDGTISTVSDMHGNIVTTITDLNGNVTSQYTQMASDGGEAVTDLADTSEEQFGRIPPAAEAARASMDAVGKVKIPAPNVSAVITAMHKIESAADDAYDAVSNVTGKGGHKGGDPDKKGDPFAKRAAGGPVTAGVPYIVGDAGRPELFVPGANGYILPRVPAMGGGSSGPTADEIATALAKVLPRGGTNNFYGVLPADMLRDARRQQEKDELMYLMRS
jgi:tape measure domain-containing protein